MNRLLKSSMDYIQMDDKNDGKSRKYYSRMLAEFDICKCRYVSTLIKENRVIK